MNNPSTDPTRDPTPGADGVNGTGGTDPIATSPRVRDQPSLTTSSGRSWLILGGLLAAISVVVLVTLLHEPPAGLALTGIGTVVLLYAAMLLVQLFARAGRLRLGLLAAAMIAMAVIALGCVLIIAWTAV